MQSNRQLLAVMYQNPTPVPIIVIVAVLFLLWLYFRRKHPQLSSSAHGTARWASDGVLQSAGMLAGRGLVIGRTLGGALIRLPRYTHLLLVGGTGSGKGVGFVIPNCLQYRTGSLVCFDTRGVGTWQFAIA